MGCVYIPPENTKYSSLDAFTEIESDIFRFRNSDEYIGLLGDFNAKTGKLPDFVETDETLLNIFDLEEDIDLITYMYDYENLVKLGVPLYRNSACTCRPNTYGHQLLDICRKNNIYIVNGRKGNDKLIGECTCHNTSVVDYFISSSKLFSYIVEFEIKEFSPLFSDVHRQLHVKLQINVKKPVDAD